MHNYLFKKKINNRFVIYLDFAKLDSSIYLFLENYYFFVVIRIAIIILLLLWNERERKRDLIFAIETYFKQQQEGSL